MIDIRYFDLFGLSLTHAYFDVPPAGALDVVQAWTGLPPGLPDGKFLQRPASGRVFETGTGDASALSGRLPLPFYLIARDPALALYTELDEAADIDGTAVYFHSRDVEQRDGAAILHGADDPIRRLAVRPLRFSFDLAENQTGARVQAIRPADNAVLMDREAEDTPISGTIDVALPAEAEGRMTLVLDGEEIFEFLCLPQAPSRLFGYVEIFAGGRDQELPAGMAAVRPDGSLAPVEARNYRIELAARSVRWRYWISPANPDLDLSGWRIRSDGADADPRFDPPARGAPGDPAPWHILSTEDIPLSAQPGTPLRLSPPNGEARAITLPIASPAPPSPGPGGPFSDVFVSI